MIPEHPVAEVKDLAVDSIGFFMGGVFDSAGDVAARNVAHWDGKAWSPLGTGYPGRVTTIVKAGRDLIVAGIQDEDVDTSGFSAPPYNGNVVAKWDGRAWEALPGLQAEIEKLVLYKGEVWAGGFHSGAFNGLAKWDGRTWNPMGPINFSGDVRCMVVHQNDLYVLTDSLMRWDGSDWTTVPGSRSGTILVSDGENIYLAGNLQMPNAANCILARWNGHEWMAMITGATLYAPEQMIVVGDYLYIRTLYHGLGGKVTDSFCRWNRKTGTWNRANGQENDRVFRRRLQIFATGRSSHSADGQGTNIYGLDGRRKNPFHGPAGVEISAPTR
jgi:hypothetical protein